ncbi:MAG TPA: hypothetical protein VIR15_04405 [Intrasporangium sp.]|uniref:hypothetical protein n=1 Tax=Intrasporangium sp. TaxID=1925024 RepID=UPI002F95C9E5
MTDTHRSLRAHPRPAADVDLLLSCARSAAALPGSRLGVASLGPDRTRWWPREEFDLPSARGPIATQLLPTLLARITGPVVAVDLADHAAAAGLSTWDLEGLASAVMVPVRDSAGRPCGLVAAFDRVLRHWADDDVRHLMSVADLLSARAYSMERVSAAKAIAHVATELERCVTGGRFHALVDTGRDAADATVQRRASEAHTMLERADVLAGRLRSFIRAVGLLDAGVGTFDLVSVVAHAAGDAARVHGVPAPQVYGAESPLPVAGDSREAHTAVVRAVSAALAVVVPDDVSLVVATRGADTATLEGTVVAEVNIDVRGATLGLSDLSRVAAGRVDTDRSPFGSGRGVGVSLSVTGTETRLVGPGIYALASPVGTRVVLSWPVDLG